MARIGVQPTGEESLAKEAAKLMIVGIAVIGLASLCERLLVGKREEQSFEGIFRAIALFIVAAWGSTLTAAAVGYWLINPYSVTLLAKAFLFGFPVVAAGVFFGTMFLDPNDGSSHAA